jgi:hypothetical protein
MSLDHVPSEKGRTVPVFGLFRPGQRRNTIQVGLEISLEVSVLSSHGVPHIPIKPWLIETTMAGWFGTWLLFFHILGMSSSQLTFTPWFFRGVGLNHQPDGDDWGSHRDPRLKKAPFQDPRQVCTMTAAIGLKGGAPRWWPWRLRRRQRVRRATGGMFGGFWWSLNWGTYIHN